MQNDVIKNFAVVMSAIVKRVGLYHISSVRRQIFFLPKNPKNLDLIFGIIQKR